MEKRPKLHHCVSSSSYEVVFTDNQHIIKTEFNLLEIDDENMAFSPLPAFLAQSFLRDVPDQHLHTFAMEVMPDGQKFYAFEIHSTNNTEVVYDEQGQRMHQKPMRRLSTLSLSKT